MDDVKAVQSMPRGSVNQLTSEQIQAAEKWARKWWSDFKDADKPKSPFFRAWFGDWRANETTKVTSVASDNYAARMGAGAYVNSDTNFKISVGETIRGETRIHAGRNSLEYQALGDVGQIIENAILLDTVTSSATSGGKMPNTAFMHSFYALYTANEDTALLKLLVEEALPNKGGEAFRRGYELKKIEKVSTGTQKSVLVLKDGLTQGAFDTISTVADLYAAVKARDKDFHAGKRSSVVCDANGKPLVMYHGTGSSFWAFNKATWAIALPSGWRKAVSSPRSVHPAIP